MLAQIKMPFSADNIAWFEVLHIGADFDEAVRQYASELCDDKRDDIPAVLRQTETLSKWCRSPSKTCSIVLRMLQRALYAVYYI